MQTRKLQRSMYEMPGRSMAQRCILAILAGAVVLFAWWLLTGGGIAVIGALFGRQWRAGDALRRLSIAAAFTIYYIRILFTEFVFLRRGVSWSEVFSIAPWLLIIVLAIGLGGGTMQAPMGFGAACGVMLFVLGSWMNSYGEYARHAWKLRPENRGHLYTEGLFRISRHPNYLGDLISFSGLCLIAGAWWTFAIPVLMLAGFVFVNIPILDSHLHDHYGAEFEAYEKRTAKLIPFVY